MSKKAYMNLLKEAISSYEPVNEFDTSKTQDVKGPFLDSILSWNGNGELKTHKSADGLQEEEKTKDAGSILERYYFNEEQDSEVETLDEADYENDKGGPGKGQTYTKGDAGPQAGTSDKKSIPAAKKEIEKEVNKEMEEIEAMAGLDLTEEEMAYLEDADILEEDEDLYEDADILEEDEELLEDEDLYEDIEEQEEQEELDEADMENAIIEKLIEEMEADDHATGDNGTEQAGTGDGMKHLKGVRNDKAEAKVKPKNYNESEENELIEAALQELEDELDDDEDDDEDFVVDNGVKEAGPPTPNHYGEEQDEQAYQEAFELFKQQIEDDEE